MRVKEMIKKIETYNEIENLRSAYCNFVDLYMESYYDKKHYIVKGLCELEDDLELNYDTVIVGMILMYSEYELCEWVSFKNGSTLMKVRFTVD